MLLSEQLQNIKTQFRLSMNGVVSQSMRENGIAYKMNFGVDLPRIKEIASNLDKNHDLAQALWKENVRESKMLAGMLQPVDSFFPEIADIWVEDIIYPEIAEVTTMSLFQYLPYAPSKVFEWIADEREMIQACGFLLAARLFMRGLELNERAEAEFLDQTQVIIESDSYYPRKTAALALKKYGLMDAKNIQKVNHLISKYRNSDNQALNALFNSIKNELE